MSDKSGKKSFFERINEALYETVETGEPEAAPLPEEQSGAPATGTASPAPAAAADQPIGNPTDLAARIRADIAGRGPALAQFLALVASFTEIIPEESGRYRAAMKALEKTGNIAREQVLLAAKDQLQALQSQREVFTETVSRKREALRKSGGAAEAVRAQIAELQQSIGRLQQQEQAMLRDAAAEEAKLKAAEEGFTTLLTKMESEIVDSREKIKKHVAG